jgi:hypothetical protein
LAEQIARAIADGKLESGTRLQTHRQMADELRLSVQTVSRAYEELIRRNLISGETGRGTFVRSLRREPDPPYLPERLGEVIDLSILKPVCEPMHLERMKKALGWLAENLPASSALSFRPNVVFPRHRAVAVEWLRTCGLDVPASNISLTNGATAAMTVALMSAAPPGSKVATEGIGHHTLTPLASYLGLTLQGLAIDEQGIIPEALDECCQEHGIRATIGDQPDRNAHGFGAARGSRRSRPTARHCDHRERRARSTRGGSPPSDRSTGTGTHPLFHQFYQGRGPWTAYWIPRCAGSLCGCCRQSAPCFQLDGNADYC